MWGLLPVQDIYVAIEKWHHSSFHTQVAHPYQEKVCNISMAHLERKEKNFTVFQNLIETATY